MRFRKNPPSYHDLHITTPTIERARIFDLPYGIEVICSRVTGWRVYQHHDDRNREPLLLAGEYDGPDNWMVLDVNGRVIVDSRR